MTGIGLVALAWTLNVDVVRLAGSIMPKSLVSSVSDVTCSPPAFGEKSGGRLMGPFRPITPCQKKQ